MTVQGTLNNGTIVLDGPLALPDGTRVEVDVKPVEEKTPAQPTLLGLLELAGKLDDMPADFAAEHDHYIHGTPRRKPKEN